MKKRIYGVGIIGAGFMGKTHTYNYVNMPLFYDGLPFGIRLVGICNRTLKKAESLKDDFGFSFATSDYHDLIERDDIDVIDVCTPNNVHREHITTALAAGKHVYADKPVCITDGEADDIVQHADRADERGIVHQVAFHNRFYPALKRMKALVDEGLLGEPLSFRVSYYHSSNLDRSRPRGWRVSKTEAGGGVLYDMGSHALDLVYHLLGRFERMSGTALILHKTRPDESGGTIEVKTEDHVLLAVLLTSGAIGTVEASKIVTGSNDDLMIELNGSRGAVRYELMRPNHLLVYDTRDPEKLRGFHAVEIVNKDPDSVQKFPGPRMGIGWLRGHIASQYNFMKHVFEERKASPSLQEGAYIQKTMNKLYESGICEKPGVPGPWIGV
ncbi:MAG: Gfo/Idh/MocA family oxidoreductase [Spirochaetes bacterium]|nr:Gfo/Idh/MocA family oxidoreductase [Spirochaetota bacterium]